MRFRAKSAAKKEYGGRLKGESQVSLKNVVEARNVRNVMATAGISGIPALFAAGMKAVESSRGVFGQPVFTKINTAIFAATGIASAALAQGLMAPEIRKATYKVGSALHNEAKVNGQLRQFLQQNKYVVIDRKGRLVGLQNKRKLRLFGRIRLESEKILNGEYGIDEEKKG